MQFQALKFTEHPIILINIAKTNYELENFEMARRYYEMAIIKDSKYEKKYAYLGTVKRLPGSGKGEEGSRAVGRADTAFVIEWYY